MEPREGRVTVSRMPIHYLDWNGAAARPDSPPPLVLIHGFLDHAWSFAPFVDALRRIEKERGAPPRRVVAIDLRGHGDSGWVQGGYYHFPDYVLDVMGVVDSLGIERFALLGHSMGSMAAGLVAGTFPDRIVKLILVEGLGPPDMPPTVAPERFRQWVKEVGEIEEKERAGMATVDEAAHRLQRTHRHLPDSLARFLAEKGTKTRPDGRVEWKHDPLHRTRSPQPFYLAQTEAFWRRIDAPVLFIMGSKSEFHAFNDEKRLKCFQDIRRADIEGAGHMVHHDAPAALAAAIADFLGDSR